ncbi:hypothetical protein Hanom_Chr00s018711g01758321 [Helianthus anomalus]
MVSYTNKVNDSYLLGLTVSSSDSGNNNVTSFSAISIHCGRLHFLQEAIHM